ncbi:hypothetical protein OVY48_08735 [Sphingobium sp. SA2]|uniref:hypothetical protein n=1 Tax=Sphingobium sp. SA2 TaxID=1524832 RepID=UPI0028C2E5CF|nr:hypothetical protein [Sphingobium sp. SA2]MDT7533508.1 hypothetical protein [Sphingobium sp. SA2]
MTTDHHPDLTQNLGLALLACSNAPALLLNGDMGVIGASESFYLAFPLKPEKVAGHSLLSWGRRMGRAAASIAHECDPWRLCEDRGL